MALVKFRNLAKLQQYQGLAHKYSLYNSRNAIHAIYSAIPKCNLTQSTNSKCVLQDKGPHMLNYDLAGKYGQGYSTVAQEEEDILFKKIEVEVKGHDPTVLNSYEKFVSMVATELDVSLEKTWTPPRVIDRLSLLKSVHIYKKHFVQYEMRTNYRSLLFKNLTGSTASIFLEYIQRNVPEGVAMKITKTQAVGLPDHINPPSGN